MNAITPSQHSLANLLAERTGQKIHPNRNWRIDNALIGLYRDHGIGSMAELAEMLRKWPNSELSNQVVDALLNNETYFYRDRAMFDSLTQVLLPAAAERRKTQRRISIWSAGCSTGQEAYSLAMAISEQSSRWAGWKFDIIGSDVSDTIVEAARKGCYTDFQVQRGLGVAQMLKWFRETDDGWVIDPSLRKMVQFRTHNILKPLEDYRKFDIILCRNVLLYFDDATRTSIYSRLADALAPDGWLMMGAGENVAGQSDRFCKDDDFPPFFRRT